MEKRMENKKPNYHFCFNGIQQDRELEKDANLGLVKLLALAPPKARASGNLQKDGESYIAIVEVFSPYRSFEEKSYGSNPRNAVQKVFERLENKLYQWRFGVYQTPQFQE